jgi:hypothetical protein
MATQQMSITQALPELKLLNKRISRITDSSNTEWCKVSHNGSPVDKEKHKKEVESQLQSFFDLVARRDKIKRAIIMSNAQTRVKIGSWEGTVAEAIDYKNAVSDKIELLYQLKNSLSGAKAEYERLKDQVDTRLERLLQSELGKDVKTNPETITALTNSFRENNKVEIVDPLNLASKIVALQEEIESFKTNVDWVITESNGRTMIEV